MPVVDLEISQRRPFADGVAFGQVGAYERIEGSVTFAVDPEHAVNAPIMDLELAPRDAEGCVRFTSTFALLGFAALFNTSLALWQRRGRSVSRSRG